MRLENGGESHLCSDEKICLDSNTIFKKSQMKKKKIQLDAFKLHIHKLVKKSFDADSRTTVHYWSVYLF